MWTHFYKIYFEDENSVQQKNTKTQSNNSYNVNISGLLFNNYYVKSSTTSNLKINLESKRI